MMLSSDLVRSVLESAPDAMIIIDDAGTVLFANRQVGALFGFPNEEVVGQRVEQLLPERFRSRHVMHRRKYAESVRVRPMGIGLDLYALRKDGTEFPVEISLSPIGAESGRPLVAAAIRDVTNRKRVEKEIKEAHEAADRANLAKSRFLATASHDLRQPLQSIALLSGALRRMVQEPDAKEALEQQEQAIAAMSRLLNALLDISKLESGAIKPDISDFKVATLLEELRAEFAGLAANKGLQLVVEPTTERAHSDPALVSQALKNLVANAIKYTPRGWVRLQSTRRGERVRIEVCDSGKGIPAEQLPYIFDEFYQVGVATNTSRDGYGLGLSIVQRVAQLLGLRVEVKSEVGIGSTFAVELPASEALAETAAPARQPEVGACAAGATTHHVLLVEDDPGVRNATRMFLKGEGYRVTTAASLEDAVARLRDTRDIDLVISDYHLEGGRTGSDVIAAARAALGEGLRAILVTGDTSSAIRDLHRDEHLRVISKPINSDELAGLIQQLLRS